MALHDQQVSLIAYRHKHMKLFIDIIMKRIYLFNIVAWDYRKKIEFSVCKKENFAGLLAHRKRGKSARASPTPHYTLNEERSARFTAQHLSALVRAILFAWLASRTRNIHNSYYRVSLIWRKKMFFQAKQALVFKAMYQSAFLAREKC